MTPAALPASATDAALEWRGVQHLLALRLDNLGDVLMTTPALAALRRARPGMRVTLLTSPAGAALAPHLCDVDEVLPFDAPWVQSAAPTRSAGAELALVDRLAALRVDAAVIFTVCTQSALPAAMLCRLAGIPMVLAYNRENPYRLLSHWLPEPDADIARAQHEVLRQLALLAHVGLAEARPWPVPQLQLRVRTADRAALWQRLHAIGAATECGYFVVHPGASAASRRYPAERFGTAAAKIAADSGLQLLIVGGPDEAEPVQQAAAAAASFGAQPVVLTAPLPLGELLALIESAALVLCNNSAPAHIAAALHRPVVVLYALTNPQHAPWHTPSRVLYHDVPCRNCLRSRCPAGHHECLLGVQVHQVSQAALDLWEETRAQGADAARRLQTYPPQYPSQHPPHYPPYPPLPLEANP